MTRTRLPVRMGNLVFGGVFIVAGSVFLTFLIWAAAESVRLRLQPAIGFRVVQTEIVPADLGRSGFNLVLHFQRPGRSETEWDDLNGADYRDLLLIQRTVPPGTMVIGRCLPSDAPARLDLCEPGWRSLLTLPVFMALPWLFVIVGARIFWSAFTGAEPIPKTAAETPPWLLFLGGALLLAVGTVPVTALGVLPVRDWVRSRDWVSTPATIEMSRTIVSRSSKGGRSYHPEVLYHYAWKGELHRSSRIGVGVGTKESESGTRRFVDAHPMGSTTTCLVNPEDPTESLLDRSLSWWSLLALPFCAFPAFGVMLLRAGWNARWRSTGRRRSRSLPVTLIR